MTTPAAELRTHLADTLANIDGWEWAPGFDKKQSPSYQGYLRQADAVLAAFPAAALAVARQVLGTTTEQPVAEAAVDGPFPQQEWQKTPCPRCKGKHPRHCPDCPNDPPCADHVCSWPDNEEDEQPEAEAPAVDLRDRIAQALTDWAYRSSDRKYAALRRDETVRANAYSRADAVLAVLPAPAAEPLKPTALDRLRRLADEAQQPAPAPAEESATVGPHCGNNPNLKLSPGDQQAVTDFKAYLKRRADADRIVAHQSRAGQYLHCLSHVPPPAARAADHVEVSPKTCPTAGSARTPTAAPTS